MSLLVIIGKGRLVRQLAIWFHSKYPESCLAFLPTCTNEPALYEWNNKSNIEYFNSISEPVLGSHQDLINLLSVFRDSNPYGTTILLSVFHNQLIPPDMVNLFEHSLNIHLSPLPRYRGTRSINFALANNEPTHGVTIHKLSEKLDQGDILGQVIFSIYPESEEVYDVYVRSLEYGLILLTDTLTRINLISPVPQNHLEATYFSSKDIHLLGERESFFKSKQKCEELKLHDQL